MKLSVLLLTLFVVGTLARSTSSSESSEEMTTEMPASSERRTTTEKSELGGSSGEVEKRSAEKKDSKEKGSGEKTPPPAPLPSGSGEKTPASSGSGEDDSCSEESENQSGNLKKRSVESNGSGEGDSSDSDMSTQSSSGSSSSSGGSGVLGSLLPGGQGLEGLLDDIAKFIAGALDLSGVTNLSELIQKLLSNVSSIPSSLIQTLQKTLTPSNIVKFLQNNPLNQLIKQVPILGSIVQFVQSIVNIPISIFTFVFNLIASIFSFILKPLPGASGLTRLLG